jgi:hypothetical protein
MKIKSLIVGAVLAGSVAAGTAACGVSGYQPAYVVSRTMCGSQYCVVMSDGDVVTVNQSIWDTILYGMIIQSYSGGYHFASSSTYRTRSITTVSYTKYRSVTRVSPSTEASDESSGDTYNSGGSSYTNSPKYKASAAAVKSASKSSYGTSKYGSTTGKSSYSSYKSSYSSKSRY